MLTGFITLNGLKKITTFVILDTTIAELVKKETDSNQFLEALETEQELMNGYETDKPNPFVEDCIARKEPFVKVKQLILLKLFNVLKIILLINSCSCRS